jgi:hypothetical protein
MEGPHVDADAISNLGRLSKHVKLPKLFNLRVESECNRPIYFGSPRYGILFRVDFMSSIDIRNRLVQIWNFHPS